MKKFTKALGAFIFACAGATLFAAICGCKSGHEHDWSSGYEIIEGTQTHAKICGACDKLKDEHTAVWSSDSDTTCNYEDCNITRTILPLGTITITSHSDSVIKGGTIQLEASEEGVIWSIPEDTVGVSINAGGLLSVAADASATSVVVTAAKEGFTSGTKTITITEPTPPTGEEITLDAGIYADEAFNLLEIKSDGTVRFDGENYAVGTVEGGRAALTSTSHTGYISKTKAGEEFIYTVEISGVVSGSFTPYPDFGLRLSDFVGTYEASDGIVVNIGETYYKCNRVVFYGGTVLVWCVEVKDASGEAKPGAREICFPLMAMGVSVAHNIINIGNEWRIAALDENADEVAVVHFTGGRESVTRRDYTRDNGNGGDNQGNGNDNAYATDNNGGDNDGDGEDKHDYEEMTGGSLTFDFSSEESKFIKCAITVTGEYVLSCESENYLGEGGVTFTVDGVDYGYSYDGQNWTAAEGGLVFDGVLWEGDKVKMEVFCLDAAMRATLGYVTVRIETRAEYGQRKAEENTPPTFGRERLGTYYGAHGGNIIEITVEGQGIAYNGSPLTFVKNKNGKLSYRLGEGYVTFTLEQDDTLSVTDRIVSARYTAYREVEWQGFSEDRRGTYSFLNDIELSGKIVNLSIELTIGDKILECVLVVSDGDDNAFRPVLIGLDQDVYIFMDGYGGKITFTFCDKGIVVLSDGFQPFVGTYTAVKEGQSHDTPNYLAIGDDNIIDKSGEYILYSEEECKLVIAFDENSLTVLIADGYKRSGDCIEITAGSSLVLNIVLADGLESAAFCITIAADDDGENVNIVDDYGDLCVGENVLMFYYSDYVIFLENVCEGEYKLTFTNVAYVIIDGESVAVDENFTAEVTVDLSAGGSVEIQLSYNDSVLPVNVKVEKLN